MTQREMFERYEKVRRSGKFNMITESGKAMEKAGLTAEEYKFVIIHYHELKTDYEKGQL